MLQQMALGASAGGRTMISTPLNIDAYVGILFPNDNGDSRQDLKQLLEPWIPLRPTVEISATLTYSFGRRTHHTKLTGWMSFAHDDLRISSWKHVFCDWMAPRGSGAIQFAQTALASEDFRREQSRPCLGCPLTASWRPQGQESTQDGSPLRRNYPTAKFGKFEDCYLSEGSAPPCHQALERVNPNR